MGAGLQALLPAYRWTVSPLSRCSPCSLMLSFKTKLTYHLVHKELLVCLLTGNGLGVFVSEGKQTVPLLGSNGFLGLLRSSVETWFNPACGAETCCSAWRALTKQCGYPLWKTWAISLERSCLRVILCCTLGLCLFCRFRGTFAVSFLEKAASWFSGGHQSPEWSEGGVQYGAWMGRGSTSCQGKTLGTQRREAGDWGLSQSVCGRGFQQHCTVQHSLEAVDKSSCGTGHLVWTCGYHSASQGPQRDTGAKLAALPRWLHWSLHWHTVANSLLFGYLLAVTPHTVAISFQLHGPAWWILFNKCSLTELSILNNILSFYLKFSFLQPSLKQQDPSSASCTSVSLMCSCWFSLFLEKMLWVICPITVECAFLPSAWPLHWINTINNQIKI